MEENNQITTIQLSKKLKKRLEKLGKKSDTYEDIIWDLIIKRRKEDEGYK